MNFNSTNINNIQNLVQNQTLTTSGSVQVTIDTSQYKEYYFTVRIDGPVTGTSPTIQFTLFDQDLFGISVTGNSTNSGVYTSTILSQSFKHDTQTGLMQLNWTITGTSPSFGGVYAAITGIKDAFITGQATMTNSTPVVIASDQSAVTVTGTITTSPNVNIHDAAGNNLTSQVNGGQRALDVGIDVAGVQVDPRSIRALTSGTDSISVLQATASSLNAEVQGDAASGASKSGNPVQIGGVFNTTQPTVTTGQVVEAQSTARGSQIVATGVDNFNINNVSGTVSLPTGAATSANQTTEITSLQLLDDVPAANNAAFNKGNPAMGQLDDTSTVVATEDNVSVVRITAQRAFHANLRNTAGTEIATSANPLRTDPTGTTTQPVSGTITANAGTGTFTTQDTSSLVDNNPFTDNTSRVLPAGYVFDDVAGTALTENDIAAARVDSKRAQILVIEDATTRGQKAAVSAAGALSENLTQVGGSSITLGQKTMANSLPVVLSSDQTGINTFLDKTSSGALTALNQAVTVSTNGMATAIAQVIGTFSATVSFEASIDGGTTYFSVTGIYLNVNLIPINALNSTGQVGFYVSGYTNFRVRVSSFTSGTVNVVVNAGAGSLTNIATDIVRLSDNVGAYITSTLIGSKQRLDVAAEGSIASAAADSGNPVKIGGVFNTTQPTVTTGQRVDAQATARGALIVATGVDTFNVSSSPVSSTIATYSASIASLATGLLSTDIFTITGSGTKTISVKKLRITADRSGSTTTDILLIKRSTANTGGTSTASTMIPHDSSDTAASATVRAYTLNPTLGTTVGTLRAQKQFINVAGTGTTDVISWEFGQDASKGVVLRGTGEVLAVNLGGVTITTPSFDIYIEWTEV